MKAKVLFFLATAFLAQSCSIFLPSMQTVSITASDPRAEIFVDGMLRGRGAVTAKLRRNEGHTILAREGDRSGVAHINTTISGTGVLDIIGGVLFLLPFIGVAAPGFYSLDATHVAVVIPQPKQHVSSSDSTKSSTTATFSGTGFFVSDSGHIVTNYHVIEGFRSIRVIEHDGREHDAMLLRSDRDNDLALLKIEASTHPMAIAHDDSQKAQELCVMGYPLSDIQGYEQKTTFGRVNSMTGLRGDVRYLQIDCPIQPGNSGGPVVNRRGEVVGVITFKLDDRVTMELTGSLPQNVNYAIKASQLARLLHGIAVDDAEQVSDAAEFSEIVQKCEQSVVQIIATCDA